VAPVRSGQKVHYLGDFPILRNPNNLQRREDSAPPQGSVNFTSFKYFDPEKELLSLNNQITVFYQQVETLNLSKINAVLRNLRVTFLPPDLKRVMRFNVDLQLDMKNIPKKVAQDTERLYGPRRRDSY
jgi:ABC-type phosphate transport system ATPase subunit